MQYPGTLVRVGDPRGAVVTWIQTMLVSCGDMSLRVDGNFGLVTHAAVRTFQAQRGLTADGVVGPATWSALAGVHFESSLAPSSALTGAAIRIAERYLDVRESGGPNRGPEIERFLTAVGLGPGHPWCAAFQYTVFAEAAARVGVPNPMPRTGSVHRCWELAPEAAKIPASPDLDIRTLTPGTLYLMDYGHNKGHMGIAKLIEAFGLRGIEGNTNAAGSREGDGVRQKLRRFGDVTLGYLDFGRL